MVFKEKSQEGSWETGSRFIQTGRPRPPQTGPFSESLALGLPLQTWKAGAGLVFYFLRNFILNKPSASGGPGVREAASSPASPRQQPARSGRQSWGTSGKPCHSPPPAQSWAQGSRSGPHGDAGAPGPLLIEIQHILHRGGRLASLPGNQAVQTRP